MLNQVQHDGVPLLGEGFLTPPKVYHRADRPKTRGHRHVRGQETLAPQDCLELGMHLKRMAENDSNGSWVRSLARWGGWGLAAQPTQLPQTGKSFCPPLYYDVNATPAFLPF